MRTKLLILITLAALVFASCSKKDDETDNIWKDDNFAAFTKTAASGEYQTIESQSKNGSIAYKVLKSGDENAERPLYNDYVKVLYTGWFKLVDWNKGDTFKNEDGIEVRNKFIFDSTDSRYGVPSTFKVSDVVDGFSTALQHMRVGDKWEVWMPSKLGYGAAPQSNIPANTTLVFEIEVVEVLKP